VDKALRSLPVILPVLDFSTIKNELFPIIAMVFSKTSSLGIKVRGLEAFVVLCGGSDSDSGSDGLDGMMSSKNKKSTASALDKYTVQEKIVPLIRAIKTKEPAVMLASLQVLKQVGSIADTEFLAMDILPILWSMSLGPLLNLQQFQSFMDLIRSLSTRVEQEHTKKLQELAGSTSSGASRTDDIMSFGGVSAFAPVSGGAENGEDDFERLVQGKSSSSSTSKPIDSGWDSTPNSGTAPPAQAPSAASPTPTFSWSTPAPAAPSSSMGVLQLQQGSESRAIAPGLSMFDALAPSKTQFSQPLQPSQNSFNSAPMQPITNTYGSAPLQPQQQQSFQQPQQTTINWSSTSAAGHNPWAATSPASNNAFSSMSSMGSSMSNLSMNQQQQQRPNMTSSFSSFSLPPPPTSAANNGFSIPPPQSFNSAFGGMHQQAKPSAQTQKNGLDSWESLL
jgi:SCY1-like protein 2